MILMPSKLLLFSILWVCTMGYILEYRQINLTDVSFSVAYVATDSTKETIFFLHGFPEGWSTWFELIPFLAEDYNLFMPNQRGYNLTSKPSDVSSYTVDRLVSDAIQLMRYASPKPVHLVAHDWGGIVAWIIAHQHPEHIIDLTILDAPHPNIFVDLLRKNVQQQTDSDYIFLLLPQGSDQLLASHDYALLKAAYANETWWTAEREKNYLDAWSQPNELNSTINWYRANIFPSDGKFNPDLKTTFPENLLISVPTLVLWGAKDPSFVLPENLERLPEFILDRLLTIKLFPTATHWLPHEAPVEIASTFKEWVRGRAIVD